VVVAGLTGVGLASPVTVALGLGGTVLVAPAGPVAAVVAGERLSHTATAPEATSTASPAPTAVHVRRFIARRWVRTTPGRLTHPGHPSKIAVIMIWRSRKAVDHDL